MQDCCNSSVFAMELNHWGRATHICVGKLTIIGSDKGLSPGRRQAIIWTNSGILLTGPLGTNFSEILIGIRSFSFKKMHLKMSSAKGHLFSLCLNALKQSCTKPSIFAFIAVVIQTPVRLPALHSVQSLPPEPVWYQPDGHCSGSSMPSKGQ